MNDMVILGNGLLTAPSVLITEEEQALMALRAPDKAKKLHGKIFLAVVVDQVLVRMAKGGPSCEIYIAIA